MKDASLINQQLVSLHDQLRSLALGASPDFPTEPINTKMVKDIVELQTAIAAYLRELLVRVFQAKGTKPQKTYGFVDLWLKRGELPVGSRKADGEIDALVRNAIVQLCLEMEPMTEDEFRAAAKDEELSELLYYLCTVQESLGWYLGRHLSRWSDATDRPRSRPR